MSLAVIPVSTSTPTTGYSTPERVSFCVQDSGAAGSILVNGLGVNDPTVSGAVDLRTMFTSAGELFRSIPLLRAFRNCADVNATGDQFNTYLNFNSVFVNGVGVAGALGVDPLFVGGFSFLEIAGVGIAGIWRVDLQLRHSTPG